MNRIARVALATTALIGTCAGALAADLSGGLRGPSVVQAVSEPVVSNSGWYLRGDVGVGISPAPGMSSIEPGVPAKTFTSRDMGDSAFISAGIGYQFNNYLRADVTGEYHASRSVHGTAAYTSTYSGQPSRNYPSYDGNLRTFAVMANGYIDLGSYWGVSPYVGAGIGAAYNRLSDVRTSTAFSVYNGSAWNPQTPDNGIMPAHGSWSLAWALHGGMTWDASPRLKVDLGYSYKDFGSVTSGQSICFNGNTCDEKLKLKNIVSNDLHLGVRYMLDARTAPTPVYTPVVAKY